jgi:hypothetical protein
MMHRRTDLWGPDGAVKSIVTLAVVLISTFTAHIFDPDRFLDSRLHTYLTPNPFIFLPFNAGPRICLGQQFAYNEVSYMLIRLLQSFDSVEIALDEQPRASRVPPAWKEGVKYMEEPNIDTSTERGRVAAEMSRGWEWRKSQEEIWPKSHLTMFALVRPSTRKSYPPIVLHQNVLIPMFPREDCGCDSVRPRWTQTTMISTLRAWETAVTTEL